MPNIKGGLNLLKRALDPVPAYSPKLLESTTARFADKISEANPKLSVDEVLKKATTQATKKLEWERVQKPALEKKYGALSKASFAESNPNKMQNTAEVVAERKRKANEFLDQPTEPWTPPPPELQAFDRKSINDALEGFPGVEQSSFPRDVPTRASTSHVEELYADPENRGLIAKQIKRGLPLGGESFYASLYPVKQAVLEAGMPAEKFDKWIHSLAPASARNSIMNEMAVGQFLRNMNARGIELTEENVAREMAAYKEKFGMGLPLMPIHRQGVQNVIEGGVNLRDQNLANIPTNYKIPTYGTQKAGDFGKSVVLDVHEAGGHTQGSRYHPYFNEQGGFGNTEYGAGERGLLGIAQELGIPGGMAQAGRWFGGGELTGLKSPRGDALDLLEKQVAYTLKQKGRQPNPANVRAEVLKQIETGKGDLLPWYRKEGMPDVRETGLQRAEGGSVDIKAADARLAAAIQQRMAKGGEVDIKAADARLSAAMAQRMAGGGAVTVHPRVHEILNAPPLRMKTGGTVQRFDDGGIASPEENNTYSPESFFESKRYSDIKKNAAEMLDKGKQSLGSDYDRLKKSARARAQLAKIAAAQIAGTVPDIASLVTPLVNSDAVLSAFPMARAAKIGLTGTPSTGRRTSVLSDEQTPYSLADLTNNAEGNPIGGSEDIIKRAQKAGLMHTGRFSPLTEIGTSVLGGLGASKVVRGAVNAGERFGKGFDKGYARAMSKQEPPFLNELGYDSVLDKQPVKLLGQQPQVMTALPGTPQGATYATKQEGPFYRVNPTSLDVSGGKNRGLREAPELQGQAPVGRTAGQAGREVPQRISDEEVARIISNPETNQPLQVAQKFTKDTQGADFVRPDIPESSLAKQSAIGRAHQLAVEGSPEYKTSVFDAYAKQMPELLEQSGAKSYDDLMEKAYRQLAKETDEQFQQLPYNFSYHRKGEGDYLGGSKEMMADVHGNKHLYVFQGGDKHDFLNRVDKATGLNENEKFRAVHDLLGHAIYGNQFGPKGEEIAWAVHQQMYSPLARLAMTAETRGQNSLVNYSPLNVKVKSAIATLDDIEAQALRKGDKALVNEIRAAKRQEYSNNFQFAPQKAVLLPPEFISPKFSGGLPDYLSAANKPAKGTESQSALTHFSSSPGLQLLDPKRYGTGIKGAEAKRLNEYEGGVKDRSYVYLGEPGTVSPEAGLGVNRYRGESSNLYDITKDPLDFRTLARESNRTPFTSKVNAGVTSPLQEANDYERLVKEYGYEGMMNPNASKPMGIMFKPTPVQPRKRGGLTQFRAR